MDFNFEEEPSSSEGAPAWMATFSDLATLLLTFFVLLLSFAELDVVEFRELLGSIREAFGVQFSSPGNINAMSTSPVELNDQPSGPIMPVNDDQAAMLRTINRLIRDQGLEDDVEVLISARGIVVRIKDRILFDSGSDRLHPESHPVLDKVAEMATVFTGPISVEGHTDDRPIRNSRFPSNWELSAGRATAVLRYLLSHKELDPNRMSIGGFAETKPIADNNLPEGQSKNRRVEFVFARDRQAVDKAPAGEASPDQPLDDALIDRLVEAGEESPHVHPKSLPFRARPLSTPMRF
jgi:chemotaxis protein MotB